MQPEVSEWNELVETIEEPLMDEPVRDNLEPTSTEPQSDAVIINKEPEEQ